MPFLHTIFRNRLLTRIILGLSLSSLPLFSIDGENPVFATVPSGTSLGWKTFEIMTGNDTLGTLAKEGFVWNENRHREWDGLGAYRHDDTTLRVFINSEVGAGTVTRVDLNLSNVEDWIALGNANNTATNQVLPPGQIVKAVSQAWTSVGSGTNPVNSPCSGNVWDADTFGPGRGFADQLYLFAEEVTNIGHFWIMDVATRTLYEAVDLGMSRWENATIIDTGRTDTIALILSEDLGSGFNGSSPLRLYVGTKNPGGDFLARNGFTGGTIYFWDPNMTMSTDGTTNGLFLAGNGTEVTGAWVTSPTEAALFAKSEDVHTNVNPNSPGYGVEVALACQDTGIYKIDFSQVDFVQGGLGPNRDSTILMLFKSKTQFSTDDFKSMDNLVWSSDGLLYCCEDGDGGDIWQVDVDSLEASYAANDFTPDANQVVNILDAGTTFESSGILEISDAVGYQAGSVFLVTSLSETLVENQLVLMVSPTAALKQYDLQYTAGTGGTITGSASQMIAHGADGAMVTATPDSGYGFVGWSDGILTAGRTDLDLGDNLSVTAAFTNADYLSWASGFAGFSGFDLLPEADHDGDGLTNLIEFANNLNPTVSDVTTLAAGTGAAGLPLITITGDRLTIEFLRRIDTTHLVYLPEFGTLQQTTNWANGGTENATPVDAFFERVIIQDTIDTQMLPERFARMQFSLSSSP